MLEIHQIFTANHLRNFTYLIETTDARFYVVDPWDAQEIYSFVNAKQGSILGVINTHEHSDHTRGNEEILKATGCKLYAHQNARNKIKGVTDFLAAGDLIDCSHGFSLKVLDTPGHTMAHLCLLAQENDKPVALICGDTLFNAGVGNCHNGGDPETLYETISQQIATLPDDVLVFPGHDYLQNNLRFTLDREPSNEFARELLEQRDQDPNPDEDFLVTTMGLEKQMNTFFRLSCPEIRQGLGLSMQASDKEVFIELRKKRNHW